MNTTNTVHTVVSPEGSLEVLSQREVMELLDTGNGGLYEQFRRCCLAVLTSGNEIDDTRALLKAYPDFQVRLVQKERGIKLRVENAPASAFVDGRMIRGVREHLFAVLRDILFMHNEIQQGARFDLNTSAGITEAVFSVLRNANVLLHGASHQIVVCWGGHSVSREEYDYSKLVGYELGLRGLHVSTGCGPGAMKGPMKGAAIGHAKQRSSRGRYIGISEPGIIAAESPNPIVNELVIMPDMEKRLEAFVRLGHGFIIFPGGAGTVEEILYLLSILLHPDNANSPFPMILSGPHSSRDYFRLLTEFIAEALGEKVAAQLRVIIGEPIKVARQIKTALDEVFEFCERNDEAYYFNWRLRLNLELQKPFAATHESMAALQIHRDQPVHRLAAQLRRVFSGIVAGNVKEDGMKRVEEHGPFEIHGERAIMASLDALLQAFVAQKRMRLPGREYKPCYRIVT
ncbi:MAG TPA: nucleotide 5'-monophosphate nucleosidase PpnN [Gammaproteobacteria bacterium]|nr:nucleotide 5'-monophosphate nucleosidase PpnN [Gammaproteobacteria bacterium]